MATLTNLVLSDRADPSVDHTFIPDSKEMGVTTLMERTGVPVGDARVTIGKKVTGDRVKIDLRIQKPVVQTSTVNGISTPMVVRTAYAKTEFTFMKTSTAQERADLVGMLEDMLGVDQTMINSFLVDLEGLW